MNATSIAAAGARSARKINLAGLAKHARRVAIPVITGAAGAVMLEIDLPFAGSPGADVRNFIVAGALLALALRLVKTRTEGFVALAFWYAGSLSALPAIWSRFFANGMGWGATATLAVILALPAFLAPRRMPVAGAVLAIAFAAVPPLGLVGMGSPIMVAGGFFPGLGFVGLALTLAFFGLSAFRARWAVSLQLAACLFAAMFLFWQPKQPPDDAWAATSHVGAAPEDSFIRAYARIDTVKAQVAEGVRDGAKLIVAPEGTDNLWSDAESNIYWQDVRDAARAAKASVLVGIYSAPLNSPERVDGLADIANGAIYPARVTIPIAMWRPWDRVQFPLHLGASALIPTVHGNAAYLMCYEELLAWPLMFQAVHHPKLLLSAANQWFAEGWLLRPQERSVMIQARLWGLPLLRAVNYAPIKWNE